MLSAVCGARDRTMPFHHHTGKWLFVADGPVWAAVMSLKEITNLRLPITKTDNLWSAGPDVRVHGPLLLYLFIDIILQTLVPHSISSFLPYFGESHILDVSPVKTLSLDLPLCETKS